MSSLGVIRDFPMSHSTCQRIKSLFNLSNPFTCIIKCSCIDNAMGMIIAPCYFLTRKNDVKDAGLPLPADLVGGRTHQRAVVLIVPGRVGQLGPGAVDRDHSGRGNADEVGRVVERPFEVETGRIRGHVAEDVDHLGLADAVHDRLLTLAHGHICKNFRGKCNQRDFLSFFLSRAFIPRERKIVVLCLYSFLQGLQVSQI